VQHHGKAPLRLCLADQRLYQNVTGEPGGHNGGRCFPRAVLFAFTLLDYSPGGTTVHIGNA
jgi:hypothetical protein